MRGNEAHRPERSPQPERLLEGKVAIVTGGNRGIGRAIVEDFAREGVSRVYVFSRTPADEVIQSVTPYGTEVVWFGGSIGEKEDIERFVQGIAERGEKIDILINNAGVSPARSLEKNVWGEMEDTFRTNVIGPMYLTGALLASDSFAQEASVVNMSSILGIDGIEGGDVYATTKESAIAFTKSAARSPRMRAKQIRVNAVAPGFIRTDMTGAITGSRIATEMFIDMTPSARFGEPEDVAYLVSFLSSRKAQFVNGAVYVIDGGVQGAETAAPSLLANLWERMLDKTEARAFQRWRKERLAQQESENTDR